MRGDIRHANLLGFWRGQDPHSVSFFSCLNQAAKKLLLAVKITWTSVFLMRKYRWEHLRKISSESVPSTMLCQHSLKLIIRFGRCLLPSRTLNLCFLEVSAATS